jgi:hypothetical protein
MLVNFENTMNLNLLWRLGVLILRKQNVISTNNFTEPKNSIFIYHIQKIIAISYNCHDILQDHRRNNVFIILREKH